ncbi:MAG: hypothetical protein BGO69_18645 [Bacteroidetes bacterium 46-16]|nr:MAG: hypothetical protein BGO69_18645 [Bacteroidetes bacterium 46-16]
MPIVINTCKGLLILIERIGRCKTGIAGIKVEQEAAKAKDERKGADTDIRQPFFQHSTKIAEKTEDISFIKLYLII